MAYKNCLYAKMSLDRFKAQAYAPVRLQSNQISTFFDALRKREFVQGDQPNSLKLSDKPFQTKSFEQVDLGVSKPRKTPKANTKSLKSVKDIGVSKASSTKSTKKRKTPSKKSKSSRDKLEALIKAAKL